MTNRQRKYIREFNRACKALKKICHKLEKKEKYPFIEIDKKELYERGGTTL